MRKLFYLCTMIFMLMLTAVCSADAKAGVWSPGVSEASTLAPTYPMAVQVTNAMNLGQVATLHGHPAAGEFIGTCINGTLPRLFYKVTWTIKQGSLWRGVMTFYKQSCIT